MVRAGRSVEDRLRNPSARMRELIDVATELFSEHGYDGTSVKDITDRMGILKGSLYSHVDGKSDLLFVVVTSIHNRFEDVLDEVEDSDASPTDRLRAFVHRHVGLILEDNKRSRIYERYWHQIGAERRSELVRRRTAYRQRVINLIEAAQDDGSIDATLDSRFLAALLLSTMDTVYSRFDGAAFAPDEIIRHYEHMLLDGLLT